MAKRPAKRPDLEAIKVYPVTKAAVQFLAYAEGLTITQFMDALIREYAVQRHLHTEAAALIAHRERIEAVRKQAEKVLRRKIEQELRQELGLEQAED